MKISIHYVAENAAQKPLEIEIAEGATIDIALRRSGILEKYKQIDLLKNKVGIHGKIMPLSAGLRDGDRIEIYKEVPDELRSLLKQSKKNKVK